MTKRLANKKKKSVSLRAEIENHKRTAYREGILNAARTVFVRLGFDDMHTTGIYSWAFLRDLGDNAERRFQGYLGDLHAKGLDRDRPGARNLVSG